LVLESPRMLDILRDGAQATASTWIGHLAATFPSPHPFRDDFLDVGVALLANIIAHILSVKVKTVAE